MKVEYVNLNEYKMSLKHIISGPAPVGRILNYLRLVGKGILKHKNGYRALDLQNNIGSAWCTEYMVGLGLVAYDNDTDKEVYNLSLTENGRKLYSLLENADLQFNENDNKKCKKQIYSTDVEIYNEFELIFRGSVVYKNLIAYIVNNDKTIYNNADFQNEYFSFFMKLYNNEDAVYDSSTATATTGGNRVPSLIQLCDFFDYCLTDDSNIIFNLEKMIDLKNEANDNEEENLPMTEYQFKSNIQSGENKVVYGTPGCGKSYYVQNTLLKGYSEDNTIRTTFYQDYTNTDFVGQILPIIESDKSVSYEFIPGPFSIALSKALEKPEEKVALVVEELNRGNAASIFGDIFQLLDRETSGENKGRSIYSITNVNLQKYLTKELKFIFNKIMIPSNLSIFATMNTSDQNVFTLDTAFKRRWKFEKLSNDFDDYKELYGKEHPFKDDLIPGMLKTWKDFVETINDAILNESDITKSEDKQLGIFFVDKNGLVEQGNVDHHDKEKVKEFAYKIFEYLWDDVLKYCRENWFGKEIKSLDDLIKEYIEKADKNEGAEVFVNGIFKENK